MRGPLLVLLCKIDKGVRWGYAVERIKVHLKTGEATFRQILIFRKCPEFEFLEVSYLYLIQG